MWITAWILAASAAWAQPTYPPFYTQEDCEAVRQVYVRNRQAQVAACVQVRVFVNGARS